MPPAFDLSRVKLNHTQNWCYHEGSHGHNPEYGSTHILTIGDVDGEHTSPSIGSGPESGSYFDKTPVAGVTTFWEIHTSGEAMVPEDVSPTGSIGHTHQIQLEGDVLTVAVTDGRSGETTSTTLSAATLYRQFVADGKKLEFKY